MAPDVQQFHPVLGHTHNSLKEACFYLSPPCYCGIGNLIEGQIPPDADTYISCCCRDVGYDADIGADVPLPHMRHNRDEGLI